MENPDIANAVYWLGWYTLFKHIGQIAIVIGGAAVLIFDLLSNPLAKKVEDARELQIAQLKSETAAAKERTAAMLSQLKPRDFSKEQFDKFVSALKGRVKQLTVFTIPDPEASQYGYAVMDALQKAGVSVNWVHLDSNVIKVQGVSSTGVTLYAPGAGANAELKELVKTLVSSSVEGGILIGGFMGEPTAGVPVPSLFIALQQHPFTWFPFILSTSRFAGAPLEPQVGTYIAPPFHIAAYALNVAAAIASAATFDRACAAATRERSESFVW